MARNRSLSELNRINGLLKAEGLDEIPQMEEYLSLKNDFGKPDPTPAEAVIRINELWKKQNAPADQAEA